MKELAPNILPTKKHFEILDGLRGVAALGVVTFHFMEMAYADPNKNFIGHGYLAVDFFFCLSGFVIGYAYDNRVEEMGIAAFFKSRIIRLHPLVILGSILGLLTFLCDPFGGQSGLYSTGRVALIFLCSIFLVPFPVMGERAFNLFGLNAPSWSLFWEYIANIFYALILYKLNRRYLLLCTAIAAALLFFVSYQHGSLVGGWAGSNFWDGGVRVSYSFLAGLLVFRSKWIIKNRLGFIGIAVLLVLALTLPFFKMNQLVEPLVVVFYFPLLVALGAGATLWRVFEKICKFSGAISYPLYMTHYAIIWMFGNYYSVYKPDKTHLSLIIIIGVILLVGFAYLAMVLYDIPARKHMSNKREQKL